MTGKEFRDWAVTVPAEDEEQLYRMMVMYLFTDTIDGMHEPKTAGQMRRDIVEEYTAWKKAEKK